MSQPTIIDRPAGVTSPSLQDTITLAGFDFTTVTGITLSMRPYNSATLTINAADEDLTNATVGSITTTYTWQTADIATPGLYVAWHSVTISGAVVQYTSPFYISLYDPLGAAANQDLCTLLDIHTIGEVSTTDRDVLYAAAISDASQAITRHCRRQFTSGTATHRFEVNSQYVDLDPYDLQPNSDTTPVTVTLNPESSVPQTLATPLQYTFEPVGSPWGTYQMLHISNSNVAWYSTTLINYGYALVDITGTYGFPTIPYDVRRACVLTVLSWTDRAQADYGSADLLDEPRAALPAYETAYGIPPGARRLLYPFLRNQVRPG